MMMMVLKRLCRAGFHYSPPRFACSSRLIDQTSGYSGSPFSLVLFDRRVPPACAPRMPKRRRVSERNRAVGFCTPVQSGAPPMRCTQHTSAIGLRLRLRLRLRLPAQVREEGKLTKEGRMEGWQSRQEYDLTSATKGGCKASESWSRGEAARVYEDQ
jgi:hypothetical protein